MDILDVPKVYKRCINDWRTWTQVLERDGFWYSRNYFKEVMEALGEKKDGLEIIFITIPVPPKMIKTDH